MLGDLRRALRPAEVAAVRQNLCGLGVEPQEVDRLIHETFRAFGVFVIEFFRGLTRSPRRIAADWDVRGWNHIARLNRQPQGWILVGAHTGNWEHLGALGVLLGRRIVVPTGTQFHPLISGWVKRVKQARGVWSVSPTNQTRELVRALARGDLVALPLDGGSFQHGVPVLLGERPARLAGGAAHLGLLSGAPILPVFSRRTAYMRQVVDILPPLQAGAPRAVRRGTSPDGGSGCAPEGPGSLAPRGSQTASAVAALTQQLADLLTDHLCTARDQWCLFRPLVCPSADSGEGMSRVPSP